MVSVTTELPYTVADLVSGLGNIPLNRIRMQPAPGTATERHVVENAKPTCELIDGVLVEKPMGNAESTLGAYLCQLISEIVRRDDLGVVLGEAGFVRLGAGQLRAPDVSFIPWSEFPNEEVPDDEPYWDVTPSLAVEVLSVSNTEAEMDRKVSEYFTAGCKLVWLIDPATKTAKVYTAAKKFKVIEESGTLEGGKVLPGFRLTLKDLFAITKRKKRKPR